MQPQAVSGVSCEDLNHCGSPDFHDRNNATCRRGPRHGTLTGQCSQGRRCSRPSPTVFEPQRLSRTQLQRQVHGAHAIIGHLPFAHLLPYVLPHRMRKTIHPKFANKHADYNSTEESIMDKQKTKASHGQVPHLETTQHGTKVSFRVQPGLC